MEGERLETTCERLEVIKNESKEVSQGGDRTGGEREVCLKEEEKR